MFAVTALRCRLQRYHLVDIVDDVLAKSEYGNSVWYRSGIAVDDSTLFEDTTLPAIDMDLCSDPDIVSVCKKSYSLEDILSRVNETDSDSADTVDSLVCLLASHTLCHGFCFTIFIRLITRALLSQGNCRMQCVFVVLRAFRKICQGHGASKAHDTHSRNCSLRVFY